MTEPLTAILLEFVPTDAVVAPPLILDLTQIAIVNVTIGNLRSPPKKSMDETASPLQLFFVA
jgi:hypothetical protein